MNIAVIKDGVCVNVCVFQDLKTAQSFLKANVWQGASEVLEAPDGYGIGDSYADGVWTKVPSEDVDEPALMTLNLTEDTDRIRVRNLIISPTQPDGDIAEGDIWFKYTPKQVV